MAEGLPSEGSGPDVPVAGDLLRSTATSRLTERAADIRTRRPRPLLVVNEQGILLGRVPKAVLGENPDATAEEIMISGPSTWRPDVPVEKILKYLNKHDLQCAVITGDDGKLMGVVDRTRVRALIEGESVTDNSAQARGADGG